MDEKTSVNAFKQATEEQLGKLGQMLDEAAKLQARWLEAGTKQLDQGSELAKSSMKYVTELSAEWQKLSLEGTKRALELFTR